MPLGQLIACAVCPIAGVAIGYFVRARERMSVEELMRQHDRLDADGVGRLGELLERKWGVSAFPFSPASDKEGDDS